MAAAKGAFQAGNASFNEADYERAITYWEDAYRRDCTAHLLLLNLARAYELNGVHERAVVALETYLARNPNSSDESQIRRRIEKLREQIQQESAATASTPAPAPADAPDPAMPAPADTETDPLPPVDSGGQKRSFVPLIVAGAGAVTLVTGGVIYLVAAGDVSDFEDQCPDRRCPLGAEDLAEEANSARSRKIVGGVVAGVGAAAVAGGLIWYFLQKPTGATAARTAPARFEPLVGRGFAGASLSGAF